VGGDVGGVVGGDVGGLVRALVGGDVGANTSGGAVDEDEGKIARTHVLSRVLFQKCYKQSLQRGDEEDMR
jgi:hypothetical protein